MIYGRVVRRPLKFGNRLVTNGPHAETYPSDINGIQKWKPPM
jgi:hypothetical protein